jgi:2-haloacid dehalogenase
MNRREVVALAAAGIAAGVLAQAGWDAFGAKLFGYPACWVNRQSLPPEEFGALPDGSGDTLSQLVQFLT